ncbi:hypothetical protein L1987_13260 [Smallanthus sonchifolius]|uniref:Uncharacterized protein n=1 Tax=Smallanthus sonchifolius TaxID=185202 RepID=A0ACB9JGY5_9ASTR|nr:hypothetical protein L1987_13260 [Smallanthus sonchifolius]
MGIPKSKAQSRSARAKVKGSGPIEHGRENFPGSESFFGRHLSMRATHSLVLLTASSMFLLIVRKFLKNHPYFGICCIISRKGVHTLVLVEVLIGVLTGVGCKVSFDSNSCVVDSMVAEIRMVPPSRIVSVVVEVFFQEIFSDKVNLLDIHSGTFCFSSSFSIYLSLANLIKSSGVWNEELKPSIYRPQNEQCTAVHWFARACKHLGNQKVHMEKYEKAWGARRDNARPCIPLLLLDDGIHDKPTRAFNYAYSITPHNVHSSLGSYICIMSESYLQSTASTGSGYYDGSEFLRKQL